MKTYRSIQHLRGVAAIMVVAFHSLGPAHGIDSPNWAEKAGASGIDIFFVVSGFIIFASQAPSDGQAAGLWPKVRLQRAAAFLWRRLLRIAPLYWLATFALIALHLVAHMDASLSLDPVHILKSLAFIPHFDPGAPAEIEPVLIPGWTLSYELFFYSLFALALAAAPARLALLLSLCLIGLTAAGPILHPHGAIGRSYTDPRLLEFLVGVLFGLAVRKRPALFPAVGAIALVIGLLALWSTDLLPAFWRGPAAWGPLAALVVWGALCLDVRDRAPQLPWLRRLGDASYSVYLTHDITLSFVREAWRRAIPPTPSLLVFAVFLAICVCASAAVGVGVYLAIERPMMRALHRRAAAGRGKRTIGVS